MSHNCPTHTGVNEMFDPLAKPNISAYTIASALIVVLSEDVVGSRIEAGSQRVTVVAVQRASMATMLLKRPSLSAIIPEPQRPRQEPALSMAMSW